MALCEKINPFFLAFFAPLRANDLLLSETKQGGISSGGLMITPPRCEAGNFAPFQINFSPGEKFRDGRKSQ
ncbi:MAG: hypothetical protein NTZ12_03615 [Candidatus Aminicenantes bacterium]|nr:hypothetical protein [Candidatus Aminicenantes bacterium]